MKPRNPTEQDRGEDAEKVELEKRLDANADLEELLKSPEDQELSKADAPDPEARNGKAGAKR